MKVQYCIIGVQYDEHHVISKVRIFQNGNIFYESKVFVLIGLASDHLIKTAFQGNDGKWREGATVQQYTRAGRTYLKTAPNDIDEDNLGELPEF